MPITDCPVNFPSQNLGLWICKIKKIPPPPTVPCTVSAVRIQEGNIYQNAERCLVTHKDLYKRGHALCTLLSQEDFRSLILYLWPERDTNFLLCNLKGQNTLCIFPVEDGHIIIYVSV